MSSSILFLILFGFTGFRLLSADIEFPLSIGEAREMGAKDGAKFHAEFGDAEGPFRWIASSRTRSTAYSNFRVRFGDGPRVYNPDIRGPKVSFQVLYFLNGKGNGLGVVYRTPTSGEHLPEDEPVDDRPAGHRALSKAAEHALLGGDRKLLASLIEAGLNVNIPISAQYGTVPLHSASLFGDANMVKFLLANGADPGIRDSFGGRAIDYALGEEHGNVCELLRRPEVEGKLIEGFPKDLLEEAFLKNKTREGGVYFLSLNGKDPGESLLELFRGHWPESKIYPGSMMLEGISGEIGDTKSASVYRNSENNEHGWLLQLSLEKSDDAVYNWKKRIASGPALAGGGVKGEASKQYGYWIAEQTSSWDE